MTQPELSKQVQLNPLAFEFFQTDALQLFDKEVSALNFDEAADLIGGMICTVTEGAETIRDEGLLVADSTADGQEAFSSVGRNVARELAPRIDDEREIVLQVVDNKTFWHKIFKRDSRVRQTLVFRNEPVQYS